MGKKPSKISLQSSEERLALHLDQTPLAVIDWDVDFRVISWNRAAETIFGYSKNEMIGEYAAKLLNPSHLTKEIDEIGKKLLKSKCSTRSSNENITKDGRTIFCEWINTTITDSMGEILGISSIVMDITESKKNKDLLRSKEDQLYAFSKALPDIALIYDIDGTYIEIISAEQSLLYLKAEKMLGKNVYNIFPKETAIQFHEIIKKTIETNTPQIYEYKLDLKGNETWFQARTSPMNQEVRGKKTMVWLAHDITKRKNAENKVQKLLQEKEGILKEVHHRIKNNMHVLSAILYMHAEKFNNPDIDTAFKDAISRIESMGLLYDKLYRSNTHIEVSVKAYLTQLIKEIISIFPNNIPIEMDLQIEDIKYNAKLLFPLGLIINEAITNIMKYAFIGRTSGKIKLTLKQDNKNILIIHDNGVGFPLNFNNESKQSYGISLITMLVNQLDGNIIMKNSEGAETTIIFPDIKHI